MINVIAMNVIGLDLHLCWQQTPDTEPVPLTPREAETLVEDRVVEDVLPLLPHDLRLHVLSTVDLG